MFEPRPAAAPIAAVCLGLIAAAVLPGCGGEYDTPQACFRTLQVAAHHHDMRAVCACLTSESQDSLVGMLATAGGLIRMQSGVAALMGSSPTDDSRQAAAEVATVLDKHGLTPEELGSRAAQAAGGPAGLAQLVQDKPQFIADMLAAMENLTQAGKFNDQIRARLSGELQKVSIAGDTAHAVVVTDEGEQPIEFRRTPAGWRVHFDPAAFTMTRSRGSLSPGAA